MGEGATKQGELISFEASRVLRIRGHAPGSLLGRDARGPLVDYPGNPHGPLAARTTVPLGPLPAKGQSHSQGVLLVFEHERSDRPVIVGLLEPREAPPPESPALPLAEARVDGRRVVLEAEDEIVLKCGEASITLRRNGRVVIRGAYVETRARGVNRVKGGTVAIN
jgi:hypothetical protein